MVPSLAYIPNPTISASNAQWARALGKCDGSSVENVAAVAQEVMMVRPRRMECEWKASHEDADHGPFAS